MTEESINDGWIRVYRRLLRNPRFSDPGWCQLWLYLLLKATHKPYNAEFNGQVIQLKPGQLITGRKVMASKLKLSEGKIERLLKKLENEHQIEQQACSKSRLITIVNWNEYQSFGQQNEQQPDSSRTTGEQQPDTNNNIKNIKNEKEGEGLAHFPSVEEVVEFGKGPAAIPEKYCRDYHSKKTEKHTWECNGKLVLWKKEIVRWFSGDRHKFDFRNPENSTPDQHNQKW